MVQDMSDDVQDMSDDVQDMSDDVQDMSDDVEATAIGRIKNSKSFAIKVEESTDVAYFAVSLVTARYLKGNKVEETPLLSYRLSELTRDEAILNAVDCYFEEKDVNWSSCCGLCTEGGKSVSGFLLRSSRSCHEGNPQYNLESLLHPQTKPNI